MTAANGETVKALDWFWNDSINTAKFPENIINNQKGSGLQTVSHYQLYNYYF